VLIDPRDGIVLYTELDDHCDKLVADKCVYSVGVCRAAQVLSVRPLDALRRRTHLSGGLADSVHTA